MTAPLNVVRFAQPPYALLMPQSGAPHQKQTFAVQLEMSALCQKRTFAVQENSDLSRRQTTMKLATDRPNGLQHLREMTLRSA